MSCKGIRLIRQETKMYKEEDSLLQVTGTKSNGEDAKDKYIIAKIDTNTIKDEGNSQPHSDLKGHYIMFDKFINPAGNGKEHKMDKFKNNVRGLDLRMFKGTFYFIRTIDDLFETKYQYEDGKVYNTADYKKDSTAGKLRNKEDTRGIWISDDSKGYIMLYRKSSVIVSELIPHSTEEYNLTSDNFKNNYTFGKDWSDKVSGVMFESNLTENAVQCKITFFGKKDKNITLVSPIVPTEQKWRWNNNDPSTNKGRFFKTVYPSGPNIVWKKTLENWGDPSWKSSEKIIKLIVGEDLDIFCNTTGSNITHANCKTWGELPENKAAYTSNLQSFQDNTSSDDNDNDVDITLDDYVDTTLGNIDFEDAAKDTAYSITSGISDSAAAVSDTFDGVGDIHIPPVEIDKTFMEKYGIIIGAVVILICFVGFALTFRFNKKKKPSSLKSLSLPPQLPVRLNPPR
tara:strand:- start:7244 stop:8611 length:1368 start_codon:yes stop_codon:yes gene_type:complete